MFFFFPSSVRTLLLYKYQSRERDGRASDAVDDGTLKLSSVLNECSSVSPRKLNKTSTGELTQPQEHSPHLGLWLPRVTLSAQTRQNKGLEHSLYDTKGLTCLSGLSPQTLRQDEGRQGYEVRRHLVR